MNIRDISPLLSDYFIDFVVNENQIEEYEKLLLEASKKIGQYYNYLDRLHDSRILEAVLSNNKLIFLLNDFTTHVFADALVKRYNLAIEHEKLIFPIQIEFESSDLSFNTVDDGGGVHRIEPLSLDEYLYENIISISEETIYIGIVAWKNNYFKKRGRNILLLLKVKNINLKEGQEEAWIKIFGNGYNELFNYFRQQFVKGRFLSDLTLCNELIDEFINKKQIFKT